ncbi:HAD family hydrolase [Oceanobacillus sp. Castelsardo]|uniref:HAD family hydrolase n=1 Tax=Oceanobacillus sp. Castelsardo TaxID=1851204 RepID=UPI0008393235|nr:HAD family hydrolase [Oceanobacillus sp. Castelsardo]
MTFKAVFLDIDGTILRPDHSYSEKTKDAIEQLQNNGIEVFLATGRPIHEIKELATSLNIDSFIGYNGALAIYNSETIVNETMGENLVNKMVAISKDNQHEFVMYTNNMSYFANMNSPFSRDFSEIFQMNHIENYTSKVADQILGITIMNVKEDEKALYQIDPSIVLAEVNVNNLNHTYDVLRTNVNKGEAIKKTLERLNISADEVIAFGDGMNDKEMLQFVGEGFAMGNANPDLFQYAKHKTTTVTEDGIYNGLKKLDLVL